MQAEFGIHVTYRRRDGVVISRTVEVKESIYDRAPLTNFRKKAKAATSAAVNAVLGLTANVEIDRGA